MKLHSPIATYLCFYRIWLVAVLVLLMALATPAKALDIDGVEILSGSAVEGGLIIARFENEYESLPPNPPSFGPAPPSLRCSFEPFYG